MSRDRLAFAALVAVALTVFVRLQPKEVALPPLGPDAAQRHAAPWEMAVAPDGRTLYVACGPRREIAVIDLRSHAPRGVVPVDGTVRGLAISADGSRLAATLRRENQVVLIDLRRHEVMRAVTVGNDPAGLAWDAQGKRLFVANAAADDVSVVDVEHGVTERRIPTGREPFAVVRSPDGKTIAVVSRRALVDRPERTPRSIVTFIDAASGALRNTAALTSCHLAEGGAFTPDGEQFLVPAVLVRNLLPILQVARGWVMSSVLAVIDVSDPKRVALLPLTQPNEGFADPSGIAVTADGTAAYIAVGGRDEVAVLDVPAVLAEAEKADGGPVHRLSTASRYVERRISVGANPRGLAVLGDKEDHLLAVSARLADGVDFVSPALDVVFARLNLAPGVADDSVQRGARLFHKADSAFQRAFSCRSCHPDGGTDGLTYDFDIDGLGKDVLLNRSLRGLKGTHPFKWSGLNPSLKRQCGMRFAKVLTRADPMNEAELDDVEAYLLSLPPPPPDPEAGKVDGRDTGAVERGRRIFFRKERKDGTRIPMQGRCVTCHPPPLYTNRMRADVGTLGPTDRPGLFDVPHLAGLVTKAPYLHDGRALTLLEIWTQPGVGDKHGVVSDLSADELWELVQFLRSL